MAPDTAAMGVVQPEREQGQNRRSGPSYSDAAGRRRRALVVAAPVVWVILGVTALATEHPLVGFVVFLSPIAVAYLWLIADIVYWVGHWIWHGPARPVEGQGGECEQ